MINLIAALLTALIGALTMVVYFIKKREEDEDEQTEESRTNRKLGMRLLGVIAGIGAVVAFILTEDMRNPMVLTDRYTILMIVIVILNLILAILSGNKKEREEEEEQKQNPILAEA